MAQTPPPLLEIDRLRITVPTPRGPAQAVCGVSLTVGRGEAVGLVGESGAGKTLTALAVMRLLPAGAAVTGGRVLLAGEDLLALPDKALPGVRGRRVGLIFQEPMTALNPVLTIGYQVAEAVRAHQPLSRAEARRRAAELLDRVALADARSRLGAYPHQLSGGQRQRVVIAIALAGSPELLIADEPTTALDVTVQAQILALLDRLRRDLGLAVLLITHDLGVVAETCDRAVVLYAGRVAESAAVPELFAAPAHPYTRALLAALPRLGRPLPRGALPAVPGAVPEVGSPPPGCVFHPRCPHAAGLCRRQRPGLYAAAPGHAVRCFLHGGPAAADRPDAVVSVATA